MTKRIKTQPKKITIQERNEYLLARAEGRRWEKDPSTVMRLHYDAKREMIDFYYRCGAVISIPRRKVPGLERKGPLPGPITLMGDAVSCDALNVDCYIPGLLEHVFGPWLLLGPCGYEGIMDRRKRRKQEDKEDLAAVRKAMKEPGPNIPWEKVKKDLGLDELIKDKKALAKEARRQSRMVRDDPQEQEILEAWEKIADRTDWKC
jgi:Protein  of unknown function (DUF3018)